MARQVLDLPPTGTPVRSRAEPSSSSTGIGDIYAIKIVAPGSIRIMATQKISVTLETSAIERAREAAGPRGLSAYVDAALEDKLERDERRRSFLAFLDELEAADPTSEQTKRRAQRRASKIRDAVSA
jgi:hypothetical protein